MGIFRAIAKGTKGVFKSCLDVKSWISWGSIKSDTKALKRMIRPALIVPKKEGDEREESFETAMARQGIQRSDLQHKCSRYKLFYCFYLIFSILSFIYCVILFFQLYLFSGFVMIMILFFFLIKAFEMSFRLFQIRERKLNCTFKEWWQGRVKETSE